MDIGFVGLGAMGAGIVPRLMAAGHAVTGWNRSKAKAEPLIAAGIRYAPTPRSDRHVSTMFGCALPFRQAQAYA
jgi:3-hydroxyisobutyrate dehydrogenase-like beta-hydroxyacid dehydrogenase